MNFKLEQNKHNCERNMIKIELYISLFLINYNINDNNNTFKLSQLEVEGPTKKFGLSMNSNKPRIKI